MISMAQAGQSRAPEAPTTGRRHGDAVADQRHQPFRQMALVVLVPHVVVHAGSGGGRQYGTEPVGELRCRKGSLPAGDLAAVVQHDERRYDLHTEVLCGGPSSTFNVTTWSRPAKSLAACSTLRPSCRQGSHHGADR
jgi:hypothetical protein